ncbi:FlgN protein [Campylobacter sputorum subsp. bubulus]|uniref:FlgN protein n=1 Tax=Campylobacter sputorum subsp. sputorum TaxID=32024 RepID=A0A381DHW8_9BACT|nr:flagellar export chaperone FlgN [Campylobacter sputorum]ASM35249.1 flagellar biosynthesis protein FlgN [Campylobacter sputorum aubsp. sputorum RM3237]ASM36927.1 flagellar biosynthesis protein FlgN [Campylobacter sputorum bv. faecalis CCUG 20703]KAB0580867.1 flagellar protein FlgN [Campylobacter sputorum subsp. sputorum]QEL05440.1 flagellar FlgK/FlgL chaperone FlgN [Campylobacter sputorum subsp. sputorum]SUX08744.1 FlgN protein [Campylobacter sputorum subsp. bubulus]
MIKQYLDEAISSLNQLIEITQTDIENIKNARHEEVEQSVKIKTELIKKFENSKITLDKELLKMLEEKSGTDLASILDEEDKNKLAELKDSLTLLQNKNREYSRYVIVIKEYYDSLANKIFGEKSEGYNKKGKQIFNSNFKLRV